jgi:DMSO reductase anchor subunit
MINNTGSTNAKDNFKINHIIYFAILAGLIVFAVMSYFIIAPSVDQPNESLLNIFMFLIPAFAIVMIFLSRFIYYKISQQANGASSLFEKIGKYRTAKIVSWAMLEGAGLFSIVAFLITHSEFFLIVFFVIVSAFILSRPSIEEFLNDFKIEGNEQDELTR